MHSLVGSDSGDHLNVRAPGGIALELYVINAVTASAFGLAGPHQAYAGSSGS